MNDLLHFTTSDWRGAIAGSIITGALTLLIISINKIKKITYYWRARNIWRPFLSQPRVASVVLTTKKSERISGTPKVSLSEVRAFSEIRNTLAALGISAELIQDSESTLSTLQKNHIISIGGPTRNNVTREILALANKKYRMPFRFDESTGTFRDSERNYASELDASSALVKDFGLAIRLTGLYGDEKLSCLVAFGLRGRGTWGTVNAITTDALLMKRIDSQVRESDFAMLLEFDFDNNNLIDTKIIGAHALLIA